MFVFDARTVRLRGRLLENLCTALQGRQTTVYGMMDAVDKTAARMTALRSEENFAALYQTAEKASSDCNLDAISVPRKPRPPR